MTEYFISGGIGDTLVVEAYLSDAEVRDLSTIHWATRIGRLLIPLFASLPAYAHVTHVDHWDYDQTEIACFFHATQARQLGVRLPTTIVDKSIHYEFPRIQRERVPLHGSRFLTTSLAETAHLNLPPDFAVIAPYTPVNSPGHRAVRDFQPQNWDETISLLGFHKTRGVVINSPCDSPVPVHPLLTDLTGRTTLAESFEVVKHATRYVGIDSWASILASFLLPPDRLRVLARNVHMVIFKSIYYPSHKEHPFVRRASLLV